MKKVNFSVKINAPKEKVWKALWDDASYRKWTGVFSEGSHAVTDWKEGSSVLFLGGEGDGMFSTIAKNIPNEFMSIRHLGIVKGGKEQPDDDETKKWSGALENYTLQEKNGLTEVHIEMDMSEEHENYFNETFPKALAALKSLAEG